MKNKDTNMILQKMFNLQNQMGHLFNEISEEEQNKIFEFHSTEQIQSLLRWIEINLDELINTKDI